VYIFLEILTTKHLFLKVAMLFIFIVSFQTSYSQVRGNRRTLPTVNPLDQRTNNERPNDKNKSQSNSDSLGFKHRDDLADSITISYRFLDSLTSGKLDSSVSDYGKIFTVPSDYVTLGNNGSPAFPVLYKPLLKSGFDAGFHAFDLYKFTLENTRFYKTTRPFTQLSYFLASGKEQAIKVLHTQNIRPNWNAGIQYNLISAPGTFQTQNTNHNSYRFFSNYQGKKKRYAAYLILVGNKLSASENGGIKNDSFLSDPNKKRRVGVPVNLGGDVSSTDNVFSTKLVTGNTYNNFTAFFRQSYDFGIKDSIKINDSTKDYLFYPKFRFQHTINYSTSSYKFTDDVNNSAGAVGDSTFFKNNYNLTLTPNPGLNFFLKDDWNFVSNDFSIRQFPQTKNTSQFIEAGVRLENFTGRFSSSEKAPEIFKKNFVNIVLHGEYRNKTRNKKWDALVDGDFYAAGLNAADFNVYATLTRFINPKLGDIQVSFQNVNRTPSYIFNGNSAFNIDTNSITKKENITVISFQANNPRFSITARNISIANFTYLTNFYEKDQFSGLVNITQFSGSAKTPLTKHIKLYSDFIIQQTTGKNPIRVPLFYTRQRLAFEGNFFKNLNLSTGIDIKYNTPYKANNYSPVLGQFFPQDSVLISNLPQVDLFFNFRIKSFSAFLTAENLNTASFKNGFAFMNNNFAAPLYPTPGFLFRFGIQWRFVN
jgi:hypothetical protein